MKNILKFTVAVLLAFNFTLSTVKAQVPPDAINFQAIARDASGDILANTTIQLRLTVIDGSPSGTEIYQELRALTTNDYGSFSFQIGRDANYVTIGAFTDIDWAADNKFLKIDYDPTNTFNWDLTLGTIEFVTVPYAFASGAVTYIDLTGVQNGDVLLYNSGTGKFEPGQINTNTTWGDLTGTPPNVSTFPNDANYLTSYTETDPIFTVWDKSTGISITESQISDFGTYLTSFTELDPVYSANFNLSSATNGDLLQYNGTKFVKFTPNYLTSEVDGSVTNEIQDLTLTSNTLKITNNASATNIDLSTYLDNTDNQNLENVLTQNADANNIAVDNLTVGACSTCDATTEGAMRYNSVTKKMEYCNASQWIPFNTETPCSPQPTTANAGADQIDIIGTTTTILAANTPTEGTGLWTITSGTDGSFVNNTLATTYFTGTAGETYTLTWTISNACYSSFDDVRVRFAVTDIDGNTYQSVTIGNQVWMAEDLKVTHYPNGDAIPNVTDDTAWGNLAENNTDDAYCFYNNNSGTDYGALYTYAAAIGDGWQRDNSTINGEGGQGVCPDGWHLPSDAEWKELEVYLGMSQADADDIEWRGTNEGGKMKETGTIHWNSPNTGATNESGFSALPGGSRSGSNGSFLGRGDYGYFWSATEGDTARGWHRILGYNNSGVFRSIYSRKNYGFSIRCLRD